MRPGEDEALLEEARRLRHLEALRERAAKAQALLEEGALETLEAAFRELRSGGRYDRALEALAQDLEAALEGARAVAAELSSYLEGLEGDPERLAHLEERLNLLERLKRKYGPTLEEVLAYGKGRRRNSPGWKGGRPGWRRWKRS